jgi:hypothetical protein
LKNIVCIFFYNNNNKNNNNYETDVAFMISI